ncbi:hypothetical protein D9V37_12240 [Nocardioides mangrovicus]|uniref:EI24 domain-containing protein n=1 Tax=Nocardioides mangrovicus TaxID=2478913 RepID=A0A3L8P3V6_9ACTN|nr:hypothetical protein D9V37_12240 [Nocardioides mangrovicus]
MVRRDRRLLRLGVLPAVVVLVLVLALLVALLLVVGDLTGWVTPFADEWSLRTPVRFLLGILVVAAAVFLAVTTFTGLTLIVGEPFYDRIWRAVEAELGGPVPDHDLGFWRSAGDAARLMGLGVLTSALVFALGFLPVVGTVVGLVLGVVLSGRLLAAELLARPLEARGLDRVASRELIRRRRWVVLGFGTTTQAWFLWPVGAVTGMPAAVAGATALARELLEDRP